MEQEIRVAQAAGTNRGDFYRVHSAENGHGWCRCVAWWVPTWDRWAERTEAENRTLREELFDRGVRDGWLLYLGGEPVGWCQCGPRDAWPKLAARYGLAPDPRAWAVGCLFLAPKVRSRGLARRLLEAVVAELAGRGVDRVEAFPRRGSGLPPDEVWTGPEELFRSAGFRLVREGASGPVYEWRPGPLREGRDRPT